MSWKGASRLGSTFRGRGEKLEASTVASFCDNANSVSTYGVTGYK